MNLSEIEQSEVFTLGIGNVSPCKQIHGISDAPWGHFSWIAPIHYPKKASQYFKRWSPQKSLASLKTNLAQQVSGVIERPVLNFNPKHNFPSKFCFKIIMKTTAGIGYLATNADSCNLLQSVQLLTPKPRWVRLNIDDYRLHQASIKRNTL